MTTASRERDRATFTDLAKLAHTTTPPSSAPAADTSSTGEAKKEDSGVIDLAALAAEEAARAAATASGGVLQTGATLRSATERPAVLEVTPARKKTGPWVTLGGIVAAAAVAAGVFVGMHRAERSESPATPAAAPVAPPPAVPAAQSPNEAPQSAPIVPAVRGVDPSTLPPATRSVAGVSAPSAPKPKAPSVTPAPTTDPAPEAVIPAATATAAPTADKQSLEALMHQAVGVTSSPAPAATTTADSPVAAMESGSAPLKPPQGAIQGALGVSLPAARGCLGPDDPISHATITFRSDGSAQKVSISGGAVGKPAEACIRSALMNTRVPPFVQATFTASTTVRPN
jgi:hypothetical protein